MTFSDDGHQESADTTPANDAAPENTSIAVYVCTHRRNEPLRVMLGSLAKAANSVQPTIEVAVVVVDDNPDQRAQKVVDSFDGSQFVRGLHYRQSGAQNISIARNIGVEAAAELADWVAMVDDDETVVEGWIKELFVVQRRMGADAVTGPQIMRYPQGSPSWLTDQPFGSITEPELRADGAKVPVCLTSNSMIRTAWLEDNPSIRFEPELGIIGGEDMVFYTAAVEAGLKAHYALDAVVYAEEPPERSSFGAIIRRCYWMGNTEYVTHQQSGSSSRTRIFLRASKRIAMVSIRPIRRLFSRKTPQFRFAAARLAQAVGMIVGVAGVKVDHK